MSVRSWSLFLAVCLLILLAAQAVGSLGAHSVTFDEPYHLGAGYAYLRTGDVRLNRDHPPLIDAWVALPLLLLNPSLPLDSAAWQQGEYGSFGDVFMWQANPSLALRLVWLGRLPNIALALLLGAAIFRWTSDLSSWAAGLLALTLYALDPGIVANASMATNDLGVAAMLFGAVWAWWRWLECPSVARLLLAGVMAGAACASKYSGLAIGPIALLLALIHRPAGGRSLPVAWIRRVGGLLGLAVLCVLTIWAAYGFVVDNGLPAPTFWQGLLFQGGRIVAGQPTYALGRIWPNGVWFYYPLALLLKTPLPVLVLFGVGLLVTIKRRNVRAIWPFVLPALTFAAITETSALQLGHRYLLPILPFMFGLAGHTATAVSWPLRRLRDILLPVIVGAFITWLALDAVTIYPHHLSFFNGLIGGPDNADHYLVDANLDWGQDLPALKTVMQERDLSFVYLGYFGSAVPDVYGIRYWPSPGFLRFVGHPESMAFNPHTPDPGWYAISRTSLWQGLVLTHPDLYAYFRSLLPKARAGYSINLYRVSYPPATPVVRAVVQGSRVADVPVEQLGWQEGERLIVKWVPDGDSFVFAMSGPARYLVTDPLTYAPDLRDTMLRHARPVAPGEIECDVRDVIQPLLARWSAESSFWISEDRPLAAPVEFDGRIRLLGYRLARDRVSPGEEVSLILLWQVSGDLMPPIASFVHMIGKDGQLGAQYDGWGAAVRGLEIGDVIVHHVRIPIPAGAESGTYRFRLGIYSPDTMVRWAVQTPDGEVNNQIWLSEMEVF
ncbi:MAG: glycosyltransferase family 39 protein [Chloroflexi bacterium]|nr:glycosyltransferase family 39 protein [Chloroflexota bacterium]